MLVTSTFLSAIALLSTSATALAMPAESDNTLEARATNSIDVNAACALTHGSSFVAQTTGKGCNDWVCVRGGVRYGIDLNQHCRDTWGSSARSSCPNGVYSWVCVH
ncbi:hypothetical protein Q7P35_010907 [Cladosporium inversicolor]